jgi:N-acyl-D-amino-acid deacylase
LGFILILACLTAAEPCRAQSRATRPATLPATGIENPDLAPLDELMKSFIAESNVPGAALAVGKDGRLLYARGFGYADLERKAPVQPTSLFRVASVSKPITAVAVLQLVEAGKLKLDDKAFDLLKLHPLGEGKPDPRLARVTVLQLLRHTGGWDSAKSFDPMFRSVEIAKAAGASPPAKQEQIIRYMLARPLDFDPGERSAYSNFGYCVLGRIIERASGQPYADHVRARVLAPLGIRDMRLGKTLPGDRADGEVTYYDPAGRTGPCVFADMQGRPVPLPYGAFCLEAMDSHGGWLASAVDLVRFASAFAEPNRCPILRQDSLKTMFARPDGLAGYEKDGSPKAAYYACGWMVRPVGSAGAFNAWHNGSVSGTASLMVRRHDGFAWAVLFNTSGDHLWKIDSLLHRAVDSVKRWPKEDLTSQLRGSGKTGSLPVGPW